MRDNAYLSFSGGKDSTVLSKLIDIALPDNKIPRLFLNTGIEYKAILDFVREKAKIDDRIVIYNVGKNIPQTLKAKGYPFKSKEHSQKVALFQRSGMTKTVNNYTGGGTKVSFLCPDKLKYQFSDDFKLKISDRCCFEFKKLPSEEWSKANEKSITITGIRHGEGGLRKSVQGCTIFDKNGLHKFHPLLPIESEWIDEFIKQNNIQLCELYYPPYNFDRTGCKGCPFNVKIQKQLDLMEKLLPSERKQCEIIWKPIYDEYRRIGYRLKKNE